MLAAVGVAFALLITAVELSKDDASRRPVYDLNLKRGSPEYTLFLAVRDHLLTFCISTLHSTDTESICFMTA